MREQYTLKYPIGKSGMNYIEIMKPFIFNNKDYR